jgi:hypothetical protein
MDVVDDPESVEIDEEADFDIQESHGGEELGLMDGENLFNRLGFHEDFVFHQNIKAERFFAFESLVINRDGALALSG